MLHKTVVLLQRGHGELLLLEGADRFYTCFGSGEVGAVADFVLHGAGTDFDFVLAGFVATWSVDDEVDVAVFHHVDDVGALLLGEFVKAIDVDTFRLEALEGAAGGVNLEAEFVEFAGDFDGAVFVAVVDGEEDVSLFGKWVEGGDLGFGVGHAEVFVRSHDFSSGFHFWSEDDVDSWETAPGEDGFFDAEARRHDFFGEAEVDEFFTDHDLGGEFGEGDSD